METDNYTLVVSGEKYVFTEEQLKSDPRNFFVTYFFGEFSEAKGGVQELVIEKEPAIFKLIQAHLRGYSALSFQDHFIPSYMSREELIKALLLEARYYCLGNLEKDILEYQKRSKSSSPGTGIRSSKQRSTKTYWIGHHNQNKDSGKPEWKYAKISEFGVKLFLDRLPQSKSLQIGVADFVNLTIPPGVILVAMWLEDSGHVVLLESEE